MELKKFIKSLCTPAYIYFIIAMLGLLMTILKNLMRKNRDHFFSIRSLIIYILKFVFILFVSWILNSLCKSGYSSISWIILLLPFIILFAFMIYV